MTKALILASLLAAVDGGSKADAGLPDAGQDGGVKPDAGPSVPWLDSSTVSAHSIGVLPNSMEAYTCGTALLRFPDGGATQITLPSCASFALPPDSGINDAAVAALKGANGL